jgi:hypothetical protein
MIMFLAAFSCRRHLSRSEAETQLKKAMTNYLYKQINYDSSKAKYEIQQVDFFEDKDFYECEFKVRLHITQKNHDTTGIMTARVSKDFSTVRRKS